MRILYHHRTLADGAEGIHIEEMVRAFRELGHDVYVTGLASSQLGGRRGVIESVRAVLPITVFEVAAVASNAVEYLQIRRAIAAIRPDFVYKRHARFDIATLLASRHAHVPTVLEVNCLFTGPEYREFEPVALERLAAALETRALKLATHTIAVSTPLARHIERISGVRPVVMPNGADPLRFDPTLTGSSVRQRYGLDESLVVGWTGVLRDWHGLELLLKALARLPEARLLIVGDGPARAMFEARATALGVSDRLVVTGRVPHDSMPDHIAAMDIAVVAHDRTGVASPMKLLEYMAMGRAVVAPRLENIRDVIRAGETGLLFTPDDAVDLTDALHRLQHDDALRGRLGHEARVEIESARNWQRNAARAVALVG